MDFSLSLLFFYLSQIPLVLNQCGSVVYTLVILPRVSLSVAVPVVNSLTLAASLTVARLLGESAPSRKELLGVTLIVAGVSLCLT